MSAPLHKLSELMNIAATLSALSSLHTGPCGRHYMGAAGCFTALSSYVLLTNNLYKNSPNEKIMT
eukprot:4489328-Amphidinium_carterae.1